MQVNSTLETIVASRREEATMVWERELDLSRFRDEKTSKLDLSANDYGDTGTVLICGLTTVTKVTFVLR